MPAAANERMTEDRAIARLAEPRKAAGPLQFSLETLLLVTTLIAACLGLAVAVPALGTPLVVVMVLALVRTLIECRRMLRDGRPIHFGDKLSSFVASLGYSFIALVGLVLSLFFLGAVALVLMSLAADITETIGGRGVAVGLIAILGLILTIAIVVASGIIFSSVYWSTITPRLTLHSPTTHKHVAP